MIFDKPVEIQKQNENTEQWETIGDRNFHARVNKFGGNQSYVANADQFLAKLNFDFRYCKTLEEIRYQPQLYRLIYRGHTFQVIDYDDYMEQHRTVRIVGQLYEQ